MTDETSFSFLRPSSLRRLSTEAGRRESLAVLRHWVAYVGPRRLVASVAGSLVAVAALWWLVRPPAAPVESALATVPGMSLPAPATATTPGTGIVRVHVAGAVKKPGVYALGAGARVVDAIKAAGGATRDADLVRINLAQVVLDTEQVLVPRRTQSRRTTPTVAPRHRPSGSPRTTVVAPGAPASAGDTAGPSGTTIPAKVNLNSASVDQLDALPGVGPATAKAIVAHRTRKGPFARIEDLLAVDGIGPKRVDALRDLVTL